jgi:hypothetical protein
MDNRRSGFNSALGQDVLSFSKHPVCPWDRTDLLLYGKSGRRGKITTSSKVELEDVKQYTSNPHMPFAANKDRFVFKIPLCGFSTKELLAYVTTQMNQ